MQNEFIIGHYPSSRIKIPTDRKGVSGQHLKITINVDGKWIAEDLDSANGTFIRDDNGEFYRIYKKQINESDIIRLGPGGANSFIFTAKRILEPEASYQFEFKQLKHLLRKFKQEEEKKEKKMEINGWISRLSGLAAVAICTLLGVFDINIDPNTRYILIAAAPILVGLFFSGEAKALKALKIKRQKLMLCPNCGKPIPEFDIEEGQCSRCKAK